MNVTNITKDNIRRIQRHRYFDEHDKDANIALKNKNINSQIQLNLQRLMISAMQHNNTEVMIALDLDTFNWRGHTDNDYMNVSIPTNIGSAIINSNHRFVAMHNHPNNLPFSIADILVLIGYPNLKTIFMCTNNCNFIEVLDKSNVKINPILDIFINILMKLIDKNIINRHSDAKYIINILIKFGFTYDKYTNT